ncbi:copper resistance protein NlpE [Muricauda sp. SCSIO 64092]|uniref:copper resistance protein NlpE n=1 Tax=Allomuricauda sp. SCSIO 64092 TaxID=2908842 RepID=UPI001FF17068|nr:copper resistance protein NlpE [Muricauda sp. SCSIO 64092]UOY08033.1 copper resistance protein NlpE [Muricauda sp. SCSIO 64092]
MKKLSLLVVMLCTVGSYAQKINQEDLYAIWHLDKYSDDESYYFPPKKEAEDYLSLNRDGTYVSVSEGKQGDGTWIFNANGKYIELESKAGKKEKFHIHFLSGKSMVVTYDTDEYRIWEVHYVSSNTGN